MFFFVCKHILYISLSYCTVSVSFSALFAPLAEFILCDFRADFGKAVSLVGPTTDAPY